ncbi:phage holin family protein [Arsenophonus sp. PmNCSU2021_1]
MRMFEKHSTLNAYLSGILTTLMGFSIDQWVALIGIICTVATCLVNWYYKWKELKLKERHYEDTEKNIDGNGR